MLSIHDGDSPDEPKRQNDGLDPSIASVLSIIKGTQQDVVDLQRLLGAIAHMLSIYLPDLKPELAELLQDKSRDLLSRADYVQGQLDMLSSFMSAVKKQ